MVVEAGTEGAICVVWEGKGKWMNDSKGGELSFRWYELSQAVGGIM
jgi:hypothetical protein